MAFTAFAYGDPKVSPAVITKVQPFGFIGIGGAGLATVYVYDSVLPAGTVGSAYSQTLTAGGGTGPPYTFAAISGSLPPGISLNSSTGVFSGTPTSTGTFSFSVRVTDPQPVSGTQPFTITVGAPATGGGNYGYVA